MKAKNEKKLKRWSIFAFILLLTVFCKPALSQSIGISDQAGFTPQSIFHIYKNSAGSTLMQMANSTVGSGANVGLTFDADASFNLSINNRANTSLGFNTNGTQKMIITKDGYVGIGTTPNDCAILDISSITTKGVLISKLALTSLTTYLPATGTALDGLLIYNTNNAIGGGRGYYYWSTSASKWINLLDTQSPGCAWLTEGNTGLVNGTNNFLGTKDAVPVRFLANNVEKMRFLSSGELLINSTSFISPAVSGDIVSSYVTAATNNWAFNGINTSTAGGGAFACNTNASNTYNALEGITYGTYSGVFGLHNALTGIGYGVYGSSNSTSTGAYGVYGKNFASGNSAIMGNNASAYTDNGPASGIYGYSDATVSSNICVGTIGDCGIPNTADYYGLYSYGRFVATGAKSAVIETSKGQTLLYCMESPEVWFEDFGIGKMNGGYAKIKIDSIFLEAVVISKEHPMKVFIQLEGKCSGGVYVTKGDTYFEVYQQDGNNSDASFSYRIVAKRKGNENERLEVMKPIKSNLPHFNSVEEKEKYAEKEQNKKSTIKGKIE